jgi:hypothetical protein
MRPVIVGIDPGEPGRDPLDPKYGSGKRLAQLVGVPPDEFVAGVDRVNLHPIPRTDGVVGDPDGARNLLPIIRGRRVVALGNRVQQALGTPDGHFRWALTPGGFVGATVPHPSDLARWWNDPVNVQEARGFLGSLTRPCIHVEGVDGSGKSTLASTLADLTRFSLVPTDDPPKTWDECLLRVHRRLAPGTVCDRSSGLISELVYGPVLRGGTITDEAEMWQVVRAVAHAVVFVYCRPPTHEVKPTFRPGEDPGHVLGVKSKLVELLGKYDEVMARVSAAGARVIRYDWTRQKPEELLSCVE